MCIDEGDEHNLHTCYSQVNRLKAMGISNRHAAIVGMPTLSEEDATMVTQAVLAMRGVNQRKQKAMHAEGTLVLQSRPMAYKGTDIAWMRNLETSKKESWIEEAAMPDGPTCRKEELKTVACPSCGGLKSIVKYKIYGKVGFSRMTCMRCKNTATADRWRCGCGTLWPKCERHMMRTLMRAEGRIKGNPERGKRVLKKGLKTSLHGRDRPFPRRKSDGMQSVAASANMQTGVLRTMMKAGSVLANRFPHLYALQVQDEVTQPCKGSGSDLREPLRLA